MISPLITRGFGIGGVAYRLRRGLSAWRASRLFGAAAGGAARMVKTDATGGTARMVTNATGGTARMVKR